MELWIRSQDKEILVQTKNISIEKIDDTFRIRTELNETELFVLAKYKTKERALEVLDEIQNILKPKIYTKDYSFEKADLLDGSMYIQPKLENIIIQEMNTYVYEMPED